MTSKFANRHYETVAMVMQACRDSDVIADLTPDEVIGYVMAELAYTFKDDNPAFNSDRFYRACVPGANVRART